MPRRVHILPDHLANQIAAGEVVERPASVVKELVENALDAGARRLDVSIRNGGKTEIRVSDDGHGMGREDAMLAIDRHATSKISTPDDLATVRTLGFRGEALPSIASVSRMIVETAERDGEGSRLLITGGKLTGIETCSRRVGTTVIVRSLFFNTPARGKFLRSTAAETRAVSEVMTVLALSHLDTAFTFESNDRILLDVPPSANLAGRIADIWGAAEADELIPLACADDAVTLSGLVQRPHSATTGGRRVYLFVNGRVFADRQIVRAADRGYATTIPPGARPSFFLFLDIPGGEVDVNVHPAKAEVRFAHPVAVEQAVEQGVRSALQPLASAPALGRSFGEDEADGQSPMTMPGHAGYGAASRGPEAPPSADQMSLFIPGRSADASAGEREEESGRSAAGEIVRPVMWQVHNTYIFAETRDGLIVVDQHSAHERVLYEELMKGWGRESGDGAQRLLFPLTLRLSRAELDVVEGMRGLFNRIGFEIEEFGGRAIIVHSVPNPHPYFDGERCLREMIRELTEGSELVDVARNQHQRLALTWACKAAVKAGQPLSDVEISELFDRLFATELPFHDIHGRPTVVQLSLSELHHRFRRGG